MHRTIAMQTKQISITLSEPNVTAEEAEQAKIAQRCIMAALDHSRAHRIAILDESGHAVDDMPAMALDRKSVV